MKITRRYSILNFSKHPYKFKLRINMKSVPEISSSEIVPGFIQLPQSFDTELIFSVNNSRCYRHTTILGSLRKGIIRRSMNNLISSLEERSWNS